VGREFLLLGCQNLSRRSNMVENFGSPNCFLLCLNLFCGSPNYQTSKTTGLVQSNLFNRRFSIPLVLIRKIPIQNWVVHFFHWHWCMTSKTNIGKKVINHYTNLLSLVVLWKSEFWKEYKIKSTWPDKNNYTNEQAYARMIRFWIKKKHI